MELLQIRDFGKSGLNTDLPAWDLPPSFLTNAQNFRIFNNKIYGFGGTHKHDDLPAGFTPYHCLYSPTADDNFWIYAGDETIYVYDGINYYDIGDTLPAYTTVGRQWTSCHLGRMPVLNNTAYFPVYWSPKIPETNKFQLLPYDSLETWAGKLWHATSIRSFGPYLIAMNMKEDGIHYPDRVRWSHPAERNEPPENWDETDPATLAGLNKLGGDGGDIIDGLALRNSFVLYRDFGITILDYSDDIYVFNFQNLTTSINIANKNCIAEVKGAHFIVASNDIVVNTGDQIQSLLHQKARVRYASIFNQDAIETAFCVHNVTTKEFWAFIPTGNSPHPSEAWVYNYRDDSWSMHEINQPTCADYGRLDSDTRVWGVGVDPNNPIEGSWLETWNTATGSWSRKNNSVFNNSIYGASLIDGSHIQKLDEFTSDTEFVTVLERTDYPLTTMQDTNTITRIYPHVKGSQSVNFQVGSQQHAGGPVTWKPKVAFNPGVDRKIDVITTGELFAFKIEATNNSSFQFSGLDVEYVHAGLR